MNFQDLLVKNGSFGAKQWKGAAIFTQQTHFGFWGCSRLCQFWWKSITKWDCESGHWQTDRQMHIWNPVL